MAKVEAIENGGKYSKIAGARPCYRDLSGTRWACAARRRWRQAPGGGAGRRRWRQVPGGGV